MILEQEVEVTYITTRELAALRKFNGDMRELLDRLVKTSSLDLQALANLQLYACKLLGEQRAAGLF